MTAGKRDAQDLLETLGLTAARWPNPLNAPSVGEGAPEDTIVDQSLSWPRFAARRRGHAGSPAAEPVRAVAALLPPTHCGSNEHSWVGKGVTHLRSSARFSYPESPTLLAKQVCKCQALHPKVRADPRNLILASCDRFKGDHTYALTVSQCHH